MIQRPGQRRRVIRGCQHRGTGLARSGGAQGRPPGPAAAWRSVHHRGQLPRPASLLEDHRLRAHRLPEREDIGIPVRHEHRSRATGLGSTGAAGRRSAGPGFTETVARHRDRQAGEPERGTAGWAGIACRVPLLGLVDGAGLSQRHLVQRGKIVPSPHLVGHGQPVQRGGPLHRGVRRGGGRPHRRRRAAAAARRDGDSRRAQGRDEQDRCPVPFAGVHRQPPAGKAASAASWYPVT